MIHSTLPNSYLPIIPANRLPRATMSLPIPTVPGDIAKLKFLPANNNSDSVNIRLLSNGTLVQNTLAGPAAVGQMNSQGNYQLVNGTKGNVFQHPWLQLAGSNSRDPLSEVANPFLKGLQSSQRQRAMQASEIPVIRNRINRLGLTGQGIAVGVLDDLKSQQEGSPLVTAHSQVVAQVINDPIWGVAPGSTVQQLGEAKPAEHLDIQNDSAQEFYNNISKLYIKNYNDMTAKLQNLMQNQSRNPSLRVLNSTAGLSKANIYEILMEDLSSTNENKYYKYPMARATIYGAALSGSAQDRLQALVNYADWVLATNPNVLAAKQRYIETTRQLAQRGIVMVCAAANEQDKLPYKVQTKPGFGLMLFAESPYVIVSAAANTNLQPGNRSQYKVADFSSRGDGMRNNPTVAAPGEEMGIPYSAGDIGHNNVVKGTSFSTPFTCGVIALMLQKNPYLTFDQIKAKLQATAVKSPYYGVADYGAGFLNAEAAVLS